MPQLFNTIIIYIQNPHFLYPLFTGALLALILFNILLLISRFVIHPDALPAQNGIFHRFVHYARCLIYFLRRHIWIGELTFGILTLATLSALLIPTPKVVWPTSPSFGTTTVDDKHPLTVEFDRPINIKKLKITITPPLRGTWQDENGMYRQVFKNRLVFYPEATLPPETDYAVTVDNISSLTNISKPIDYLFNFRSPAAPKIISVSPSDKEEQVDINRQIIVTFDQSAANNTEWTFNLAPQADFVSTLQPDGKHFIIKPASPLKKGIIYTLSASRAAVAYSFKQHKPLSKGEAIKLFSSTFATVASPTVKSVSPTGSGVLTNASVKVEFRQDMDRLSVEKAWQINPSIGGSLNWENNRTLSFHPTSPWQKNTRYIISVRKTAQTSYGTTFDNDYNFDFTTIGFVRVASFSPGNGAKGIAVNKSISTTFDQAVDHSSAESHFSLSPSINGIFSWQSNTMIFDPANDFAYNSKYTATVSSGVKSVNGLDSKDSFSASFNTAEQVVSLNVPLMKQEHYYTCGIASARMALAYRGVSVSELGLLNQVGYDSTPRDANNNIWGNPNVGFVGTLMGENKTGYGVHWDPVAKAMRNYRNVEVKTGWNAQGLASELAKGNPVVIWWVNGVWPTYEKFWNTPGGTSIRAVNGMHAVVVKGFTGSVNNPTSFLVNDPWWPGRTYDTTRFLSFWRWFNYTAIVVN